jgi:hypothetical protein
MDASFHNEVCAAGDPQPIFFPAILDRNSTSRNYETVGQSFDLYYTQFHHAVCQNGAWTWPTFQDSLDRDLVRLPLKMVRTPAGERLSTLENGIYGANGFDWTANGSGTFYRAGPGGAYEGNYAAHMLSPATTSGPYGGFTVNWPNGTDTWYGSAFYLNPGFISKSNRVMIMRWLNSHLPTSASRYGGIVLDTDDQFRLIRETLGGAEQQLGSSFTLPPEGTWFWLEVHQKLASDPAGKPISEVFVDGRLVASSTAVNAFPDSDGVPSRLYFGYPLRTSASNYTEMSIDRSSISLNQRGPIGAPATPTGVTGSEGSGYITLTWNWQTDNAGGGFRVYEQQSDGTWAKIYESTSAAYLNTGLPSCVPRHYRVSAFNMAGLESPASEEIELVPRATSAGC